MRSVTAACAAILAMAAASCGARVSVTTGPGAVRGAGISLPASRPAAPVRMDVPAGSVTLEAADAPGVEVAAEIHAPTEADLARVQVYGDRAADGSAEIGYRVTGSGSGIHVTFVVRAPAASPLRVRTGAGSIAVRGFTAGLDAESGAGSLDVRDVAGDLRLQSGAGAIDVRDARGTVAAKTGAGHVDVTGSIVGDCSLRTSAGAIRVTLPADCAMRVEGGTGAGSIGTGFPALRVEGGGARRTVAGVLGSGEGGTLRLRTEAGSIEILSTAR